MITGRCTLVRRAIGHWEWEVVLDCTCLLFGVNYATGRCAAFYIHVGPLMLGGYRWVP